MTKDFEVGGTSVGRRFWGYFLGAAIVSGLIVAPLSAHAASSIVGTVGPIDGRTYTNQADVNPFGTRGAKSFTHVGAKNPSTAPSGYMGAQARIYRAGTLVSSSGMIYTNSASGALGVQTTYTQTAAANYSAKGLTHHWDRTYYRAFNTFATPSISN